MSVSVDTYSKLSGTLFETVFSDRCHQFITRHKWGLFVTPEGYEIDEYDGEGTEYLVAHESGRHLTSCRLRSVTQSTMLIDHFSNVFPAAEVFLRSQSGRLYEITRFLRAPAISVREGIAAQVAFAKALDRFREEREAIGFIGVVYSGVSRYLRQNGVRFLVLDVSTIEGRRVELICITQAAVSKRQLVRQQAIGLTRLSPRLITCDRPPEEKCFAASPARGRPLGGRRLRALGVRRLAATVQARLDNLIERGLEAVIGRLFLFGGAKALSRTDRQVS